MTTPTPATVSVSLTYQQPVTLPVGEQIVLTTRLYQSEDWELTSSVLTGLILIRHYLPGRPANGPVKVDASPIVATPKHPSFGADEITLIHVSEGSPAWRSQRASYHQLNRIDREAVDAIIANYPLPANVQVLFN